MGGCATKPKTLDGPNPDALPVEYTFEPEVKPEEVTEEPKVDGDDGKNLADAGKEEAMVMVEDKKKENAADAVTVVEESEEMEKVTEEVKA